MDRFRPAASAALLPAPQAAGSTAGGDGTSPSGRDDELLYSSERSQVIRRYVTGGSVICKKWLCPDAAGRVRHEKAMLERLSSLPGVAKLSAQAHAAGASGDSVLLEDDMGVSLAALLRSEKIGIGALLGLALELTQTIAAMHRLGVVHRDINPSNILLVGAQRRPVLIDFDIASTFAEERPAFTPQAEISGTLAYIAPEQTGRMGRVMDQRADLYSLGATLYELAAGHPPFEGKDPFALIRDHLVTVAASPATLDPGVPQALSDIIMRLLQKEPDARYQSAEGLASDLARLIERREHGVSGPFSLGEHDFPRRLLPPSRLVGREPEIVALHAAFEDALAGRRNGLLVAGAPGVGKSALVNELRSIVTAKGGWFVKGKLDQYNRDSKSGAVLQACRSLLRLLLAEPESVLVPVRARLLRTLQPNAALAAAMLPEMALLLGIVPGRTPSDPLDAKERLAQIGSDLLDSIASKKHPLVFVLDDLQWASAAVLDFVDAVVSQTSVSGLLFVGAYRTTEVDAAHPLAALLARWRRSRSAPRELFLNDLRAGDLGALLQGMLRLRPSEAAKLAVAVGERTHGNPYDTVEFINALRRDGALTPGPEGWTWDEATIRRYLGRGDVVDLLNIRIDALPSESRALLEIMAALGGDIELPLLQAAAGVSAVALEERLTPALDDGLLVLEHGAAETVRFRHDRVQQAAYGRLEPAARLRLHLTIARRLTVFPEYGAVAAQQYLPAIESVRDPEEGFAIVALFRSVAAGAGLLANYATVERFLAAATTLLDSMPEKSAAVVAALQSELHVALYNLGRLAEADSIYRSIERRAGEPLQMVASTCVQIRSLTNRNLLREAVALGLGLLERIGIAPPERRELASAIEGRLDAIYLWCGDESAQRADFQRPEATDPVASGAAKLIERMMAPAFFYDNAILAWLVLESLRLWSEHGPCAALVGPLSQVKNVTIALREDYRTGYAAARHVLAVSQARGYEPATSRSRFLFSVGIEHWFESFEESVVQARLAHDGLLRGGDLQTACFTFFASIAMLLECSSTVDEYSLEVEAGLAFSSRIGNDYARQSFLASRQLAKSLRGETSGPGSFADASFDEELYVAGLGTSPGVTAYFHVNRALCAFVFGQTADLLRHASAAMPLLPFIPGIAATAVAHMLAGLALARRLGAAPADERVALLEELDVSRDWLRRRAGDAPHNFLHSVRLVEAERAWALPDFQAASAAFDAALQQAQPLTSPRHRALVAERAGLFYIEHGVGRYGRQLLSEARQSYAAWGATGKVAQLERDYPFLRDVAPAIAQRTTLTTTLSSDTVDIVGILRASQALSSQTSLELLKAQVAELLAELTGATAVLLVLRTETGEWLFSGADDDAAPVSVRDAGARGLLPLTAFRYVERTQEPLLLADATEDDRFARDPYFAGCAQCSMLVVPILGQGELRAVVLLENRLSRGAFTAGRLDAVMLIAGQLAVSLDNALLYASLERKVAERTEALAAANEELSRLSRTDGLTGLVNRRGFDERLEAEWRRAGRTRTSLGLAMIDIDHFKNYNDRYGHPAGDECLRRVAQTLKEGMRPASDVAARYGGEEFVLLLPDTGLDGTCAAAERRRVAVAALREPLVHGSVTISIGIVACATFEYENAARFVEAADVALYQAKRNGRNQVARAAGMSVYARHGNRE